MSDDRITALQEEIGQAGRVTVGVRKRIVGAGALVLIAFLMPWSDLSRWPELSLLAVIWGGCLGVAAGAPVAYAVAAVLRGRRRDRLRRQLAALTPMERAEVLEPLWREPTDTGKIADQLRRDFRFSTELTPAPSPGGRGDEAAACEVERAEPRSHQRASCSGLSDAEGVAGMHGPGLSCKSAPHYLAVTGSTLPRFRTERRGITRPRVLALLAVPGIVALVVGLPRILPLGHRLLDAELIRAADDGDSRQIAWLLAAGASVDATNRDGETPLMKAAYWGFGAAVNTLLSHRADVNWKSGEGKTSLSEAVSGLYRDLFRSSYDESRGAKPFDSNQLAIRILLAHRADPNAGSVSGWTLLSTVSSSGDAELAGLFLAEGASVNARNTDGTTALRSARKGQRHSGLPRFGPSKFSETERLLLRAGGVE